MSSGLSGLLGLLLGLLSGLLDLIRVIAGRGLQWIG